MIKQIDQFRFAFRLEASRVKDSIDTVELNQGVDALCLVFNNIGESASLRFLRNGYQDDIATSVIELASKVRDRIDVIELRAIVDAMFEVARKHPISFLFAWYYAEIHNVDAMLRTERSVS